MNKICSRCGTHNEERYNYCKNCGNPLNAQTGPNNQEYENYNPKSDFIPIIDEIDGVQMGEMATFVGKNSFKIIGKFSRMQITNSKISWCWPVAILGFFFGFFGASIWFFYRKIYKPAIFLFAAGFLLMVTRTIITFGVTQNLLAELSAALSEAVNGSIDLGSYLNILEFQILNLTQSAYYKISNALIDAENYISAIVLGLYSMQLYKRHAVKKITAYRSLNGDSAYYTYGLNSMGSTSGGIAALAVVAFVVLQNMVTSVPFLAYIF